MENDDSDSGSGEQHRSDDGSSARLKRAERIAESVMLADDAERADMIDAACGDDAQLRTSVLRLLSHTETLADPGIEKTVVGTSGPAAQPSGQMPEMIGRYRIRRIIQSGGMGTVYEAVQENPRRKVAIKVMKAGLASPSALRRFEYESQVLGKLNHPTIAEIYEAGTFDDGDGEAPFFAMEYIEGAMPIDKWAASKRLSTREKLLLFESVCDAIHHGHQKGVVHRDLKPDNILVDAVGRPRVIDFGVARATDSDIQMATMQTDVGQLVGTLYYMSPEQCEANPELVDTRSDVYALGVILFELLTGRRPHQLENVPVYDAARMIREEAPSRMSTLDRTLGGDLETIVGKSLEKDKDRRYQSALELKQDIQRYLGNEPIEARPPSLLYQARMFARRHKALAASVAVVFAVLLGTTIWSLRERGRAESAAQVAVAAEQAATLDRDRAEAANAEIASTLARLEEEKLRADGERDRAQLESDRAQLVADFLTSVFEMGSPEYAQGRTFTLKQLLREASDSIKTTFGDQMEMEVDLRTTIGRIQQELGDLEAAEPNLQKALLLLEREYGLTHPLTREVKVMLAELWREQGRYQEAESRLDSLLLAVETEAQRDDPQVLAAKSELAMVMMSTLRIEEAKSILDDVVARSRRVLGTDHPDTMHREVMLTMVDSTWARLSGVTEPSDLVPAFESASRIESALGALHPITLNGRLAEQMVGFTLNQMVAAPEDAEKVIAIAEDLERVVGSDHTDSLSARTIAGLFQLTFGDFEGATESLDTAYTGLLEKYGRDHPETMTVASLLGAALDSTGRFDEAVPLLESSWYGQKQLWGEDDIRAIQAESIWAMAMMNLGRFKESEPHFEHVMEVLKNYPISITDRWMFGVLITRMNLELKFERMDEAKRTVARLRQLVLARDDADSVLRLAVLLQLSETSLENDLEAEALATTRAFTGLVPIICEDDAIEEVQWLGRMAKLLQTAERHRLLLDFTKTMFDITGANQGIDAVSRANALADHGGALRRNGRSAEAIPLLAEALGDMKVLHGLESDQVASCEFELLEAMIADGAVQAARERVSQLESIMLARSEVDDQRLTNLFATHLSVLEPEYEQAAALFQILLDRCAGDDACTARSIQIFLENAPPDIMSLLHIELRARLEESIESQGGSDPDMVRVAMEMMLFETELESRADALDATILGEQLGMRAIRMLARLDGASNSELQSTIERVEARLSSLLGDEHDLTLATRAEALVGTPDEVEAIRALQRAAIVSPIEERRRFYLQRANAIEDRARNGTAPAGT